MRIDPPVSMRGGNQAESRFLQQTREALIAAPFTGDGWMTALDMVARATRSRGANLVCLGGAVPSLNLISGFDQVIVDRAFSDPALWGAANWRVATATQPFDIQHDLHYKAYRKDRPTGDYCDASNELDMPFGCQTIFSQDRAGFIGLAIMRGHRDGPADPDMIETFQDLMFPIARALKAEMAMAGNGVRLRLGALDETKEAVILLNRHGWVCGASDRAANMLEVGTPLRMRGARIIAARLFDDHRLQQLLRFLLHPDTTRGESLVLKVGDGVGGAWRLNFSHLPDADLALGFDAKVALRVEEMDTLPVPRWSAL